MKDVISMLESVLFVASKPFTIGVLAQRLGLGVEEIEYALEKLGEKYTGVSGILLARVEDTVQLITNPLYTDVVEQFTSKDILGELTKAQLETVTVIAYRGPITRPEIEEIRGVNSAIIVRNLLIRGLVEEHEEKDSVLPTYSVSLNALRHLGISRVEELPEYERLSTHVHFDAAPETQNTQSES